VTAPVFLGPRTRVCVVAVVIGDVTETHTLDKLADVHRRSEAGDIRGKVTILPR
jgi:hypothetical protein